ncbi:hypothetical protein A2U01_0095158, partial [Trifolium medium]|nr:hypothetical protein [Trifolium medium]
AWVVARKGLPRIISLSFAKSMSILMGMPGL